MLDGSELRNLVHAALFSEGGDAAARNKLSGSVVFGAGGAVFVVCTLLIHQVADWFLAVPFGLFMGAIVGGRLAMKFSRMP